MKIVTITVFFTLLLTALPLHCVGSFWLVIRPNGQKVLILGDIHGQYSECLEQFVNKLKNARLHTPLPFILELDERAVKMGGLVSPHFDLLVKTFGKTNKSTELIYYDPRSLISAELESARQGMYMPIGNIPYEQRVAYPNQQTDSKVESRWTLYKKLFREQRATIGDSFKEKMATVKDMRNWVQEIQTCIEELVLKYEAHKKIQNIFKSALETCSHVRVEILKELSGYDEDRLFDDVVVEGMLNCATTNDLLTYYKYWYDRYCTYMDYLHYDCLLLDRILSKDTQGPVCYFVGYAHAELVLKALVELPKWKVKAEDILDIEPGAVQRERLVSYCKVLLETTETFLAPLCYVCSHCSLAKTEGMMCCSICKKAYYCDVKCQRAAWKKHKKVCEKVVVKS